MLLRKNIFVDKVLKNVVNAVESDTIDLQKIRQLQKDEQKQQELTYLASQIMNHREELLEKVSYYLCESYSITLKNTEFQNDFVYVMSECLSLVVYAIVSDLKYPDTYFENYLEELKIKYIRDEKLDMYIKVIDYLKDTLTKKLSFLSSEKMVIQVSKYFDFLLKGIL